MTTNSLWCKVRGHEMQHEPWNHEEEAECLQFESGELPLDMFGDPVKQPRFPRTCKRCGKPFILSARQVDTLRAQYREMLRQGGAEAKMALREQIERKRDRVNAVEVLHNMPFIHERARQVAEEEHRRKQANPSEKRDDGES